MIIGSIFRDLKCAQYNGVDEASYRSSLSFGANTQGTFFIRVKIGSLITATSGAKCIIGVASSSSSDLLLFRQFRNTGLGVTNNRLQVIKTGAGAVNFYGSTNLVAGSWMSLHFASNGSALSMGINGVAETLTTLSGSNTGAWLGSIAANRFLSFGAQNIPLGLFFDGCLNEGMYFDRPLTPTELSWLHNAGTPRNPHRYDWAGALKSWWRFGDSKDTGTTIFDEIGVNDLTNQNMDAGNYVAP